MPQPAKAKDVIGGPVWPKETRTPEEVEEVWILGGLELCEPGLFEVGRNSADYRKRRLQNLQRYIELQDDALYAARMGLERVLRPLEQVEGAFRSLMQPAPGRVEK
ncbi:MAG: hypothetical protein GY871_04310 [Actinomycetales bacterium]|nr:hypothetical protein [Actinomycetales bacterium]